jgi:hypothetical protein
MAQASVVREGGRLQHTSSGVGMPGTACAARTPLDQKSQKSKSGPSPPDPLSLARERENRFVRTGDKARGEVVGEPGSRKAASQSARPPTSRVPRREIWRATCCRRWPGAGSRANAPVVESRWPLHGDRQARGEAVGAPGFKLAASRLARPPMSLVPLGEPCSLHGRPALWPGRRLTILLWDGHRVSRTLVPDRWHDSPIMFVAATPDMLQGSSVRVRRHREDCNGG